MTDLLRKRKSIEASHLETWFTKSPKRFFFRHEDVLEPLLRHGLQILGLLERGKRNALRPVIRPVDLEFEDLPTGFCGFSILHLSDLHIDGMPGLAEQVVAQIAPLDVDLCVFTGDYRFATFGPCHNVYPEMRKIVSAVRSRSGILGILGNHDYAEEIEELEAMGVRMLMNDAVEIRDRGASLWVAGVDDDWDYDCADLDRALSGVPQDSFKVLLAHSPDVIDRAAAAGIRVYLCGHTHAGQIRLPLIGAVIAPADCPRRFYQGTWKVGAMEGYTSSGIGCSLLPVRFRCPPEIGLIRLFRSGHQHGEACRGRLSAASPQAAGGCWPLDGVPVSEVALRHDSET